MSKNILLKALQQRFHEALDAVYGKEEVLSFFFLCTEHYYGVTRFKLALDINLTITEAEQEPLLSALKALKNNTPIQYIIGETAFYGLPFKVNENTLIPRPETEELVSLVLENTKVKNSESLSILDIGTGSGCIAITLAKNIVKGSVYALDVSAEALKIAKENADLNTVEVSFVEASILESCPAALAAVTFDVIVSNPPYVRQLEKEEMQNNVLDYEPHLALFVDDDNPLVFYKAIAEFAIEKLKPNGQLYFEINEYLGQEMIALVEGLGFANVKVIQDMFGKDRMLSAIKLK